MNLICSYCNEIINPDNVNISANLAKCDHCNTIHEVTDLRNVTEEKELEAPPKGSRIVLNKYSEDEVKIFYPKKGLTFSDIPKGLFVVMWLAFMAFWTKGTNIILICFSIPGWLAGFTLFLGLINLIFESQTLLLKNNLLTVIKNRPIKETVVNYPWEQIQSVKTINFKADISILLENPKFIFIIPQIIEPAPEMPALITGRKTEYFFAGANEAEKEWITRYINTFKKKINNK